MNNFELVLKTNDVFGKPFGNFQQLLDKDEAAWKRVRNQANCLPDEVKEVLDAIDEKDATELRDAVSDVLVFAYGVAVLAGFNPNPDMRAVFESNMSKLCDTQEAAEATVAKYAAIGVQGVIKGTAPELYVVSAKDQTATTGEFFPENKFLKGVNYQPPVLLSNEIVASGAEIDQGKRVKVLKFNRKEELYDGIDEMLKLVGKTGTVRGVEQKSPKKDAYDEVEVYLEGELHCWYFYRKDLQLV